MSEIQQKWATLKKSEQQMIMYGLICIIITLIYFYAWKPYNEMINNYRQQILYTQEDISWLKQVSGQINQLKSGTTSTIGSFNGSLINIVDKSIKQNRMEQYVGVLENSGDKSVVIQLNKISFNQMIKWTGYIKKRYGILVKNIDLNREGDTELVNARIILKSH